MGLDFSKDNIVVPKTQQKQQKQHLTQHMLFWGSFFMINTKIAIFYFWSKNTPQNASKCISELGNRKNIPEIL